MTLPDPPQMEIERRRRSPWRNLSLVWLVPVLAILISLGVVWKNYSDRGTLISISLPAAAGIVPGESTVRFRDVVVGVVENVRFAPGFASIVVDARINREVAATMPENSEFWVVKPVVTTRGISGLSTVLSGVYIEGDWEPVTDSSLTEFKGLAEAPIVRPGRRGSRIRLRSTDASLLPEGAPVYYRGVEVGQLDVARLSPGGDSAVVDAFINAPHDRYITTATRFWDTSGFTVKLGPGGVDLNVASVGALLTGGVAFDSAFTGGEPLKADTVFNLFVDETSARQSIFTETGINTLEVAVIFSGSVNGLSSGAPVEYRGLRVGQVTAINAFIENGPTGGRDVKLRTTLDIEPLALGLTAENGRQEALLFLRDAVAHGMRARLTTTSIFSAALKIELIELPGLAPAEIAEGENDIPILPNVPSDLPNFTATAEGVLQRVNALPIEDVMKQAISLMTSIEAITSAQATQEVPGALAKLLNDGRAFLNKDDTQALPTDLRSAIADLRSVVADLQKRGAVEKLARVLESAEKIASNVAVTSQDFPTLVKELRDLAAKATALKTEDLVDKATALLASADALIGSPSTRTLPSDLSNALAEIQAALKELREGGAVSNVNAALSSANTAAKSVATAAEDLPKLTAELQGLVDKANGLIDGYGEQSSFNRETLSLLRELQTTAKAVSQLAKTIERNPNSLLIGR